MSVPQRVVVIGAGVGGLAAAIRLRLQGHEVQVIEKNAGPGGRCGQWSSGGYTFDLGPTLLLLRPVFEKLFRDAGRRLEDYLTLVACQPNYRIHFGDHTSVRFSTDLREMREELERIEPGSFAGYLRYLEQGRVGMQRSLERFVTRNFDSPLQFFTPGNLRAAWETQALRSLRSVVSGCVRDERLRIALSFQTMYLGISPYDAPAIYSLLPYTELAEGIWFPKGGMFAIPRALEQLASELGVELEYGSAVERILTEGRRATGVRLASGSVRPADLVVANPDLPYTYRELIPEARFPRREKLRYTSGAYVMYLGLDRRVEGLEHHVVFLANDVRGNFDDIFRKGVVPDEPSFYVNVPARTDPSLAPAGCDGVYVLVPVPHSRRGLDWASAGARLREQVLARLEQEGYGDLRGSVRVEHHLSPDGWGAAFNLEHGAAFGLSHDFFQVACFRPRNQDATFPNLFFVGASTQPGTGLPMVLLSAELLETRVATFLSRSEARRPPAAVRRPLTT